MGQTTYSSDERFSSDAGRHLGVWSLRIKAARDADNGLYECQLSVYPPQSVFVELKIIGNRLPLCLPLFSGTDAISSPETEHGSIVMRPKTKPYNY